MFGWGGHEQDGGLPAYRKLLELFSVGDFKTKPEALTYYVHLLNHAYRQTSDTIPPATALHFEYKSSFLLDRLPRIFQQSTFCN